VSQSPITMLLYCTMIEFAAGSDPYPAQFVSYLSRSVPCSVTATDVFRK